MAKKSKQRGGVDPVPTFTNAAKTKVNVARAVPAGATAIGVAVGASGAVPRQLGIERAALAAAGFEGKPGQTFVVPRDKNSVMIAIGIGEGRLDASKLRDAAASFARAAARHANLATGLADVASGVAPEVAAEAVTEKLMDLKPGLAAYTRASHLRWLRGDVDGARNVARLAIESAPPGEAAAFALCDAADMFFHLGDVDGAAEGYRMALQRLGDYPRALLGQARVALAQDKPAEALAPLGRALEVSPSAEAAWLLGDAHSLLKDAKAAQEAYARVEVLGRSDARTLAHYLAQSNQKLDHAWMLMERELKGRGDIHTLDVAAWVLHRQGKHKEALEHITRARRLGTREPRLQFHEGAIRLGLGDATGVGMILDND